jgi:3-deoxy-D-manno-octulosonic acid kinase
MSVSQRFQRRRDSEGETLIASEAGSAFLPSWFDDCSPQAGYAASAGRGGVRVFDTSIGPLIRRNYLRGGLPRFFTRDRYLWTGADRTRAFAEFRLLSKLRDSGLSVPTPIAARYLRRGLFYRAALLMRFIPEVRTLADVLERTSEPSIELDRIAPVIARLHCHHVWHADLNASNILIDAAQRVWLIDFDRAVDDVTDHRRLAGNLDRLRRSLRKLLPPTAFARIEAVWPDFLVAYRSALAVPTGVS